MEIMASLPWEDRIIQITANMIQDKAKNGFNKEQDKILKAYRLQTNLIFNYRLITYLRPYADE
jgi:hypothetical protein